MSLATNCSALALVALAACGGAAGGGGDDDSVEPGGPTFLSFGADRAVRKVPGQTCQDICVAIGHPHCDAHAASCSGPITTGTSCYCLDDPGLTCEV